MPVPGPERNRVPRWRTMIIPAFTVWPSNNFTPRRFAFESRPLREEPRPFLCAIYVPFFFAAGLRVGAFFAAGFFAGAFGFAAAFGSSFFAAAVLERAPIDWISISESFARCPVWRR